MERNSTPRNRVLEPLRWPAAQPCSPHHRTAIHRTTAARRPAAQTPKTIGRTHEAMSATNRETADLRRRFRAGLLSDLRRLNASAELHRLVLDFLTARADGNRRNHSREDDSALHSLLSYAVPGLARLASDPLGGRRIGPKLHWRVRNFPAASAKSNSRNDRRDNDHAPNNLHGSLSQSRSAIACYGVPVVAGEIKFGRDRPGVLPPR